MKKMKNILLTCILILFLFNGCDQLNSEDEEPTNVHERIKGTWTIYSVNFLGIDVPGNGSSLTFGNCIDGICTGQDYDAGDGSTGTFTYEFIEDASKILITDDDPNGGNYNTTWAILDFDNRTLRMTGDLGILGNMLLEMSKD